MSVSPGLPLLTPRLRLRDFEVPRDVAPLFALNEDPEVIRYTGDGRFADEATAHHFFEDRLRLYAREGMGRWAVESLATGELLGWCGLRRLEDHPAEVDLGYRFFRRYWNQGYATEASRACLAHGFGTLGLPRIIAQIDPRNGGSRAVAVKLGMRLLPETRTCGAIPDVLVYELTAEEWASVTE